MRLLLSVIVLSCSLPVYAAEASARLKFKNGPVCMCSGGLSEEDIRAAREKNGFLPRRVEASEVNEQPKNIRQGIKEEK